jgi:N-methylhydantoinase B
VRIAGESVQRPAEASVVDLEILRTTLIATTQEVAAALGNAAPTVELSQMRTFTVAIADAKGSIVAIEDPQQLGSMAQTVAHAARYFEFDLADGDVILTNDPYTGGTKVQDLTLLAPLIADGELLLYVTVRVRVRDMGGQLGGNLYPAATELLAEGVPVTPVKIQRLGQPVRDILSMLLLNGRRPAETRRILDAARAALTLGRRRLAEIADSHGVAVTRASLEYSQTYSERLARQFIGKWQSGSYEAARLLELEPSAGGSVTIRLTANVSEGGLILDFSASDGQRPVFINSTSGTTASCAIGALLTILGEGIPANAGLLRAAEIRTRPGTVTHASWPAPVGWGDAHCGNEITEIVAVTLQRAAGVSLPALTVPRPLVLSRKVNDRSDQLDLGRWGIGGASALAQIDGWGRPQLSSRAQLPSIEQWETESHYLVESLEFARDGGGAGQWRGSPGVEASIALRPDQLYTLWTDTSKVAVDGLSGGRAGPAGEVAFHLVEGWQPGAPRAIEQPIAAARLKLRLAGGGGCGDPRQRERAAVIDDLADGLISAAAARDVYGLAEQEIATTCRTFGGGIAGDSHD